MPHPIPDPAVPTAIDVALWFLERARAADVHLPAQKLQNLLFLAATLYERERGAVLMPAAFVRNELAVVEPNVYRLLEDGRPNVRGESVPLVIQQFLDVIWSRYAHYRATQLNDLVVRELAKPPERRATPHSMRSGPTGFEVGPAAPATSDSQPMHRGRPVAVTPWRPPAAPKRSSDRIGGTQDR